MSKCSKCKGDIEAVPTDDGLCLVYRCQQCGWRYGGACVTEAERLERENARLKERIVFLEGRLDCWQKPSITLFIGLEPLDCVILDVGHADVGFTVECAEVGQRLAYLESGVVVRDAWIKDKCAAWEFECEECDNDDCPTRSHPLEGKE